MTSTVDLPLITRMILSELGGEVSLHGQLKDQVKAAHKWLSNQPLLINLIPEGHPVAQAAALLEPKPAGLLDFEGAAALIEVGAFSRDDLVGALRALEPTGYSAIIDREAPLQRLALLISLIVSANSAEALMADPGALTGGACGYTQGAYENAYALHLLHRRTPRGEAAELLQEHVLLTLRADRAWQQRRNAAFCADLGEDAQVVSEWIYEAEQSAIKRLGLTQKGQRSTVIHKTPQLLPRRGASWPALELSGTPHWLARAAQYAARGALSPVLDRRDIIESWVEACGPEQLSALLLRANFSDPQQAIETVIALGPLDPAGPVRLGRETEAGLASEQEAKKDSSWQTITSHQRWSDHDFDLKRTWLRDHTPEVATQVLRAVAERVHAGPLTAAECAVILGITRSFWLETRTNTVAELLYWGHLAWLHHQAELSVNLRATVGRKGDESLIEMQNLALRLQVRAAQQVGPLTEESQRLCMLWAYAEVGMITFTHEPWKDQTLRRDWLELTQAGRLDEVTAQWQALEDEHRRTSGREASR